MDQTSGLGEIDGLAAVVTAFKPGEDFFERFAQTISACHTFVVVDNTPGGFHFGRQPESPKIRLLQDGRNKGLGPALNAGVRAAREAGCKTVVLFDQDSSPSAQLLRRMRSEWTSWRWRPGHTPSVWPLSTLTTPCRSRRPPQCR